MQERGREKGADQALGGAAAGAALTARGAATPTAAAVTPTRRQRLVAAGGGRKGINFELSRGAGGALHGCRFPSGLARSPPHAVGRPLTEEPPRRFLRRRPWCVWGAGLSPAPESGASPPPSGLLPPSSLRLHLPLCFAAADLSR